MVRAFKPPCNRCPGGHALSNSHRDCDACSSAFADGNGLFNADSCPYGCAIRNRHPDENCDAFSLPHSNATANSHSTSSAALADADPWGDVSSALIYRGQRALDRRRCDPPDAHGL